MPKCFDGAKWIGEGLGALDPLGDCPALCIRRVIHLERIENAICYITGLGLFALYINGKRVGKEKLTPSFTDYNKRVYYSRYNVKKYLRSGENVIAIEVGNGFYNQTVHDAWDFEMSSWRGEKRALFSLFVNKKRVLASDESFRVTLNGPTYNTITRTGEYYDARLDGGWRNIGFDDSGWDYARAIDFSPRLYPERIDPICECEKLLPEKIYKSPNGWICDFGVNIAGYVGIKMMGRKGQTIRIKYAEMEKDKKRGRPEITNDNIKPYVAYDHFSEDRYTFSGDGIAEWRPSFVYHGFRYVEITGLDRKPKKREIAAYFVHTALKPKGSFTSSDELLCWIYNAGVRSFLSNWHGISEDCPHREKNGWTADAVISANYAVFLFDMKRAYMKWLTDILDAQKKSGQLPGIAPTGGWGYAWGSGPAWDFVIFALPNALYEECGDIDAIKLIYNAAKRYLKYAKTKKDSDGLVKYGLSDWCPPKKIEGLQIADNRFSDSCYYYMSLRIMARFSNILSKDDEAEIYSVDADELLSNIRRVFIRGDDVDNSTQGALAMALYFGIVDGKMGERVAKTLVNRVIADEYKFKVGILGMKALLNSLSAYGYTDIAYRMVNRYDYPSYGYMKSLGLTTLAEDWECTQSLNHHMYSDVVNWMIRNIAGIQNKGVAYNECVIKPFIFDEKCSSGARTTVNGEELSVLWKYEEGEFLATIVVPNSITARLEIFDRSYSLNSGKNELRLTK